MTLQSKTLALLRLIRPELPISAGICVVVGQVIALGKFPPLSLLLSGFLLGFFLSSSQMIFNDYFDLEVDRVNAPERPFPSGQVTRSEGIAFGAMTAVIALAIALSLSPLAFLLCLVTWVLGFLYNWKLKSAGLWGNLIVSSSVGMTFIIGGITAGQAANPLVWLFGLIAFTFDLAEEIAGDAMDMEGDRKRASRSLAIVYGKRAALSVCAALLAGVILLTWVPIVWGKTGLGYWIPIGIMDVLILYFTVKILSSQTPQEGRGSMRAMYLCVTLGLVAFLFASFH